MAIAFIRGITEIYPTVFLKKMSLKLQNGLPNLLEIMESNSQTITLQKIVKF
jgi:hypothetical protein